MSESSGGHLRWPALLTPTVGFAAFLAAETVKAPRTGSADEFIWILPTLIIVNVVACIPFLLGALGLILLFRAIPHRVAESAFARLLAGGLIGAVLGLPFAYVLNGMPSADEVVRFDYLSMWIGSTVAGGFCGVFYLPPTVESQMEPGKR